ncbi:MAG: hypothetical protein AB4911_00695 [Oscillochloridaceae bacterium umkhey_bin13]
MTQFIAPAPTPEPLAHLFILLERYRERFPVLGEELARQRALTQALAEQRAQAEQALGAWRAALSQRWTSEVAAYRCFSRVLRQLADYDGDSDAQVRLLVATGTTAAHTPAGLLQELRRLDVWLGLLHPAPAFAKEAQANLREAADQLEATLNHCNQCELARHALLVEQRLAASLIEHCYQRSRRLLAHHALAEDVAILPDALPTDRAA